MARWPAGASDPETWVKGGRTTQVETSILSRLLPRFVQGYVVDIGTGTGRLLPLLENRSERLVAVDVDFAALRSLRRPHLPLPRFDRVGATGAGLPFRSDTISLVVAVRVLHRFVDPGSMFREVRRVLKNKGQFVLSFTPTPSLKTLQYDIWNRLKNPDPGEPLTSSRIDCRGARFGGSAGHVASMAHIQGLIEESGFERMDEVGTGLEDFPGFRLLPQRVFERLSAAFPTSRVHPTWFMRLEKSVD